jgi:predicted transposase YbfD/YdcC
LNEATDERYEPNTRHKIGEVIMIVLLAVLSNCNEWTTIEIFAKAKEKWLREFLVLENGIPSIDTIQRVMAIIKPVELYRICVSYFIEKLEELAPSLSEREDKEVDIISLDGKTSNGSSRKQTSKEAISSVNTMSAYSTSYGLALAQEFIPDKTNEIPIAPELIKQLNATNCIFTWDALNTQKETVKAVDKKADYVGALKGNQHLFYKEVKLFFEDKVVIELIKQDGNYLRHVEPERAGVVTREYFMISDVDWFSEKSKWRRLNSFGMERKKIEKADGAISYETRYFISSLENDIELFAYAVRSHWHVENNLHAPLDIVFKEDKNKTLEQHGAKALGVVRRVALMILKLAQPYYKKSLNSIRYQLAFNFEHEIFVLFKLLNTSALKQQLFDS